MKRTIRLANRGTVTASLRTACWTIAVCMFSTLLLPLPTLAQDPESRPADSPQAGFKKRLATFFATHCYDCHGDGAEEGGLSLDELDTNLGDAATFASWERIYDRVVTGEMPPPDSTRPSTAQRTEFVRVLRKPLTDAHASVKGTVLRRLNRREYENTINDLFGTSLKLQGMLPEDARAHEFDNVGETLGVSMTHLQRYMEAAGMAFDAAVANVTEAPEPSLVECHYRESEVDRVLGKNVKRLDDGALVRFSPNGLSRGHLREGGTRAAGKYRIRVTGYAYQSQQPVVVNVSGTSYKPGAEQRSSASLPSHPENHRRLRWSPGLSEITCCGSIRTAYSILRNAGERM